MLEQRAALTHQKVTAREALIRRWRHGTVAPAFREWRAWARQHKQRSAMILGKAFNRLLSADVWR